MNTIEHDPSKPAIPQSGLFPFSKDLRTLGFLLIQLSLGFLPLLLAELSLL